MRDVFSDLEKTIPKQCLKCELVLDVDLLQVFTDHCLSKIVVSK